LPSLFAASPQRHDRLCETDGVLFRNDFPFCGAGRTEIPGQKVAAGSTSLPSGEPGPCRTQASGLLSFERRQPGFPNKAARKRETI